MTENEPLREEGEISDDEEPLEAVKPIVTITPIEDSFQVTRSASGSNTAHGVGSSSGRHHERSGRWVDQTDYRSEHGYSSYARNARPSTRSPVPKRKSASGRRRNKNRTTVGKHSVTQATSSTHRGSSTTKDAVMKCSDHEELQSHLHSIRMELESLRRAEEETTRKLQLGSSTRDIHPESSAMQLADNAGTDKGGDEDIEELELRRIALVSAARGQTSLQSTDKIAVSEPLLISEKLGLDSTRTAGGSGRGRHRKRGQISSDVTAESASHLPRAEQKLREIRLLDDSREQYLRFMEFVGPDHNRHPLDYMARESAVIQPLPAYMPPTAIVASSHKHVSSSLIIAENSVPAVNNSVTPTFRNASSAGYAAPTGESPVSTDNYETVAMDISQPMETPIVVASSTTDNYESVSMDIDSEPQSPADAQPLADERQLTSTEFQASNEEEEEVLMRQQLLRNMERRKATASIAQPAMALTQDEARTSSIQQGPASPVPELLPKKSLQSLVKSDVSKRTSARHAHDGRPPRWRSVGGPIQKPVVITLGDTSSSDEDTDLIGQHRNAAGTVSVAEVADADQKNSLLCGLDMFLRQERQNAEQKQHADALPQLSSKTSVDGLPAEKQAEYNKLKAELKKRELALISKRELENERRAEEKELAATRLKDALLRLSEKRMQVDASHTTLSELAEQINIKSQAVKTARTRADRLREQLATADHLVLVGKQHLLRLLSDRMKLQDIVKKHNEELARVEAECKQLGKAAHGDAFQLPVSSTTTLKRAASAPLSNLAANVPVKKLKDGGGRSSAAASAALQGPLLSLNSAPASPSKASASLAVEKQRLLDLEQACAARLQELRDKKEVTTKLLTAPLMPESIQSVARRLSAKLSGHGRVLSVALSKRPSFDKDSDMIAFAADESSADEGEVPAVLRQSSTFLGSRMSLRPQLDVSMTSDLTGHHATAVSMPSGRGSHGTGSHTVASRSSARRGKRPTTGQANSKAQETKLQRVLAALCEKLPAIHFVVAETVPCCAVLFKPGYNDAAPKISLRGIDEDLRPSEAITGLFSPADSGYLYESCLLQFKSYRLSPYYRTRSGKGLLSNTCANAINARRIVCAYDLLGKCNDAACKWQHVSTFSVSPAQVMQDLVLYCPSLAGVTANSSRLDRSRQIEAFVAGFMKKHEAKMNVDEMCLLLVTQIRQELKLVMPHSIISEPRAGLASNDQRKDETKATDSCASAEPAEDAANDFQSSSSSSAASNFLFLDDVVCESDRRYFMLGSYLVPDMEQGVADEPTNVDLWIKLAYKRLHDVGGRGSGTEEALDRALNVLSRGLEKNYGSERLWLTYLNLYSAGKRAPEDRQEYVQLCRQALCLAPTYDTHWQHLMSLRSVYDRAAAADETIAFLSGGPSQQGAQSASWQPYGCELELTSHRITEVLLFIVAQYVNSGHLKNATRRLKTFLHHPSNSAARQLVIPADAGLLWSVFVYLLAFHRLPVSVLLPEDDDNPGRLVCKRPFVFPWQTMADSPPAAAVCDQLCKHFRRAIAECTQAKDYELNLKKNYVGLLKVSSRWSQARELLQSWVAAAGPGDIDIWLELASFHHAQDDFGGAVQAIEEALTINKTSAKLHGAAAYLALARPERGAAAEDGPQREAAVELLARGARACFADSHQATIRHLDTVILYRKLIGEALPLDVEVPPPSTCDDIDQKVDLWLNYCWLLELKDSEEVREAYETALYHFTLTTHLQLIWKRYLMFLRKSQTRVGNANEFWAAFRRCLHSMPSKILVPFASAAVRSHWTEYTFHNSIIDSVCAGLARNDVGGFLEKCLHHMPRNVGLMKRGCVQAVSNDDLDQACRFCQQAMQQQPAIASIDLCKMYARLLLKAGRSTEALQLLQRATRILPYSVALWKDYILCLITGNSATQLLHAAIEESEKAGINVKDFVDTVAPGFVSL